MRKLLKTAEDEIEDEHDPEPRAITFCSSHYNELHGSNSCLKIY
jgi:hypothetical protein